MKRVMLFVILAAFQTAIPAQTEGVDFVPGEILIKPKVRAATMAPFHTGRGARVLRSLPRLGDIQLIKLPPNAPVLEIVEAYNASGLVHYAQPNWILRPRATPNDQFFTSQWHLKNTGQDMGTPGADIKATYGWNWRTSAKNVIIAILDTGAMFRDKNGTVEPEDDQWYHHPDLADNIWVNLLELNGTAGIDDDGNGAIDDVYGWNSTSGNNELEDLVGHGTHVAGIAGAVANEGYGIAGVAWDVQIMPIRCNFDTWSVVTGVDYAIANGAHIINMSFGMGV